MGHDAVDVRDVGIISPDEAVFAYAQSEHRAVVTRDLGFSEMAVAHPGISAWYWSG
jgi:predicted nuclease of predicted toxin-antitoxin system